MEEELNEKKPEGFSSSEKFLSIDIILDNYDIRHPKPSISKATAKKMLKRDLEQLIAKEVEEARVKTIDYIAFDPNLQMPPETFQKLQALKDKAPIGGSDE